MRVEITIKTISKKQNGYYINKNWYYKNQCEIDEFEQYAIVPKWLAIAYGEKFKILIHKPEKIEPKYNQEALDELKY